MEEAATSGIQEAPLRFAIGRIHDASARWRVLVETWPETADHYRGRFVFQSDDVPERQVDREGPALLQGRSAEDVVRSAYELPEDRIRSVLRSLS